MTTRPRKLIETVIPLPEINDASAYDKMPGIGPHPKGIHHWWARLPLPCARAILFASVVDDPADVEGFEELPEAEQAKLLEKREDLFGLIRRLLQKKPHEHPHVFEEARKVIEEACDGKIPEVLDPFTGGGSIPLEAQRLGFQAHGRDLNPVPALITKATIDYPARFYGKPAVNPEAKRRKDWRGAQGLANDVRYYGQWMLEQAKREIGHLYPDAEVTPEMAADRPDLKPYAGKKLPVIAWIWARTVESPDPAFAGKHVPLISTFWLCSKKGKEVWLSPSIDSEGEWIFQIKVGTPTDRKVITKGTKAGTGPNFYCISSGAAISGPYIKSEGKAGRMGFRCVATVCSSGRGRVYLPANDREISFSPRSGFEEIDRPLSYDPRAICCPPYGMKSYRDLFTVRQIRALETFSRLVEGAYNQILRDGGSNDYATAISTYLAFAVDRLADFNSALSTWKASGEQQMHVFGRQVIPMVWDFCEGNVVGDKAICWKNCIKYTYEGLEAIPVGQSIPGLVAKQDAAKTNWNSRSLIISTDPPYYDNVPYADVSDYFYVWLRRSLKTIQPDFFQTILTPKSEELIATPYRHGGDRQKATEHFESGFRAAFTGMKEALDPRFPLTVYYAMKQSEDATGAGAGAGATGWETLLNSLIGSGFQITATWPVSAAQNWRMRSMGSNALANYIVLACRLRPENAPTAMRRDFLASLRAELPSALRVLQHGNIAPVDLAQAAIGPGMAIYSRHGRVLEPDGEPLTIRSALRLINQVLSETLDEQEGDFDPDTRWAVTWFKEHGFETGPYGKAEELAVAKAVTVQGLVDGGILYARGGNVHLLRREELPDDWNPAADRRLSIWEATEHLIRVLQAGGESAAAELLAKLQAIPGGRADAARELAYLLFTVCERKGWNKEALGYNSLVIAWPSLMEAACGLKVVPEASQRELDL